MSFVAILELRVYSYSFYLFKRAKGEVTLEYFKKMPIEDREGYLPKDRDLFRIEMQNIISTCEKIHKIILDKITVVISSNSFKIESIQIPKKTEITQNTQQLNKIFTNIKNKNKDLFCFRLHHVCDEKSKELNESNEKREFHTLQLIYDQKDTIYDLMKEVFSLRLNISSVLIDFFLPLDCVKQHSHNAIVLDMSQSHVNSAVIMKNNIYFNEPIMINNLDLISKIAQILNEDYAVAKAMFNEYSDFYEKLQLGRQDDSSYNLDSINQTQGAIDIFIQNYVETLLQKLRSDYKVSLNDYDIFLSGYLPSVLDLSKTFQGLTSNNVMIVRNSIKYKHNTIYDYSAIEPLAKKILMKENFFKRMGNKFTEFWSKVLMVNV